MVHRGSAGATSSSSAVRRRAASSDGARSAKRPRASALSSVLKSSEGEFDDLPLLGAVTSCDESDSEEVPPAPFDEDAEVLSEICCDSYPREPISRIFYKKIIMLCRWKSSPMSRSIQLR